MASRSKFEILLDPCEWGEWVMDGNCSQACGTGIQIYTRDKTWNETNNGYCENIYTKSEPCNEQPCPGNDEP